MQWTLKHQAISVSPDAGASATLFSTPGCSAKYDCFTPTSDTWNAMLLTVKDACQLHPMALDYAMADQIENLSAVIEAKSKDAQDFFESPAAWRPCSARD